MPARPQESLGHTGSADPEGPMWSVGEFRQAVLQMCNMPQVTIGSNGIAELLGEMGPFFHLNGYDLSQ